MTDRRVDRRRRNFLTRCCQGISAVFLPIDFCRWTLSWPQLPSQSSGVVEHEFHLQPHYKMQRPIDAVLLKAQAAFDDFATEKYADQIESILRTWRAALLQSPTDLSVMAERLSADFMGSSPRPVEQRLVRAAPPVEVHQGVFAQEAHARNEAFLQDFHSLTSRFSKLLTVEFQITSIVAEESVSSLTSR